ncbi:hypothetical protein [Billgrantia ethanolica]|uniref:Uncharacterized protein n=1 Tax=Billgrantia ethanolica TaxID=2733486 RepID=A0ABS9A5C9_9GAMM|nr:hypothetical protein [Halomonas ethanolica]MCE8003966.1 hypothetical protein [Halomonas ethanolica]
MGDKMIESIFYDGEELTLVKSVDSSGFLKKIGVGPQKTSSISIKEFEKGKETLWLLEENGVVLAICRPPPNEPTKILNSTHKEMVETFGEFIEVLGKKEFENLFELFSCDDRLEEVFSLIRDDYEKKAVKTEEKVELACLYYLGRESDGKIYLYDSQGEILVYAYDHEIDDRSLHAVEGQPADTFYRSNNFKTVVGVLKKCLSQE